jgi:two-component system cell cycle sensor histidine kinase/response regulator CckA
MKVLLSKLIGESRELMLELGEQVGLVLGDRGQLEQVVMNLAVNARDAMEGGGTLTIGTKSLHVSAPSPEMPDLALGDYTVLYVKDTGKGLDSSTQARMFEPFFTTKDVGKGTGLGLSTVLGIVKQCRGHIRVNSAPNQGTCFEILLPVTEQLQEESSESHNLAQSESSVAPTILLVEDERPVRKVVCECLKRAGYQVLESHSCVHALNLFETHGATIDVVLSDVIMPGMSGPEVVGQLRAVRPDLKVLYMSGYLGDELMPDEVSREQILFKPFTPSDLVAAVRDLLDS